MNPPPPPQNPDPNPHVCPTCAAPLDPTGCCIPCLIRNAVGPDSDPSLLSAPSLATALKSPLPHSSPTSHSRITFGDYTLLEQIGEGGMGTVYRALKKSLNKEVAIKFIKSGRHASQIEINLFHREAELASKLDHPHIVDVYELGLHDGHHFLVLRLVEGQPLDKFIHASGASFSLANRVRLIRSVARAVHHAHQRGIIHRDLKPGNILVDDHDQPHVTDFGLARWSQSDSILPQNGHPIGTPAYMAPEQIQPETGPITVRSDVWSIGVILYSLITGRPPFHADTYAAVYQAILNAPLPPLANAQPLPSAPSDLPTLSQPSLRDLESICQRALEKRPANRYSSAAELADDLDRWLDHQPVIARPISRLEHATRWCRRHPARAGLVVGAVITAIAIFQAVLASNVARREAFAAKRDALAARREENLRKHFHYVTSLASAQRAIRSLDFTEFHLALQQSLPQGANADLRSIDWALTKSQGDARRSTPFFRAQEPISHFTRAPLSNQWAVLGTHHIWLLSSNAAPLRHWAIPPTHPWGRIQFSPDNAWLAASTASNTFLIQLSNQSFSNLSTYAGNVLEFSPDSRHFAVSANFLSADDPTNGIAVYQTSTRKLLARDSNSDYPALRWTSPNSILGIERRGTGVTLTLPSLSKSHSFDGGYQNASAQFSRDGRFVIRSSAYGKARIVDAHNGQLLFTIGRLPTRDLEFATFPNQPLVASTSIENAIDIIHFGPKTILTDPTNEPYEVRSSLKVTPGHTQKITGIAFGANTNEIFSSSLDGWIYRTPVRAFTNTPYFSVDHFLLTPAGARPAFRPDGQWVALLIESSAYGGADRSILLNIHSGQHSDPFPGQVGDWTQPNFLFASTLGGQMAVWDVSQPLSPKQIAAFEVCKNFDAWARREPILCDNGRWILSKANAFTQPDATHKSPCLEAFNVATFKTLQHFSHDIDLYAASPTRPLVVLAHQSGLLELWNLDSNATQPLTPRRSSQGQTIRAADIRFSKSGNEFAISTYDYDILRFDGITGQPLPPIEGLHNAVTTLDFSHDERTLLGGDDRFALHCWNLFTKLESYRDLFPSPVYWISASPTGGAIVTGHAPESVGATNGSLGKGSYRIWRLDLLPSPPSPTPIPHPDSVWARYATLAENFPPIPPAKDPTGK